MFSEAGCVHWTQVTSAFLHASWYHLAVNMYFLWSPLSCSACVLPRVSGTCSTLSLASQVLWSHGREALGPRSLHEQLFTAFVSWNTAAASCKESRWKVRLSGRAEVGGRR